MDIEDLRARGVSPTRRGRLTNPVRRLLWPFHRPYFAALVEEINLLNSGGAARIGAKAAAPPGRFLLDEAGRHYDALKKDLAAIAHRLASLEDRPEAAGPVQAGAAPASSRAAGAAPVQAVGTKGEGGMAAGRKTALVTGAGRNIGRAVALGLAQDGFNLVVNGSSDRAACEAVAEAARGLGVEAMVAMADIGSAEACAGLAAEAIGRFGAVDVLVNNAALRPRKPFLEMSEEDWRRVMAVDLDAAVWLARACLPGMVARGWGRVVNFTGMNAIHGYAGRAPVSVAKHGVWGLTKALGKEFGPQGITVNAVSPGPIAADEEPADAEAAKYRQAIVARVPLGRQGTPEEVAAVVRMLVSDGGAYVNGQMLQVNGGAET